MALIQRMVHKNWLFLLVIMLILLLPKPIRADVPSGSELFQKLIESFRTQDFEGKFNFMSLGQGGNAAYEAIVIRDAPDKRFVKFISPPEMNGMGMVINGNERWRIPRERDEGSERDRDNKDRDKDRGRGREHWPLAAPPPREMMEDLILKNIKLVLHNYDVRTLEGGSIANRDTYLVEIEPKSQGKASMKVWLDAEKSIILKLENYTPQKTLATLFVYSEINFAPQIDESIFKRPERGNREDRPPREEGPGPRNELWNSEQGKLDSKKIRKEAKLDLLLPTELPAGFVLQSIQSLKFGKQNNIHLRYTDGLTVISVFQSSEEVQDRGRPPWRGGKIEKVTVGGKELELMAGGPMTIFKWKDKDVYLTLMGELEQGEMTKIVRSFVR